MKVHFKNLDGLRFLAAALVVFHHCYYFKKEYSYHAGFLERWALYAGWTGVNLFFVLSGFLISHFLLVEKDQTGTISYRKFYIGRALRIWPLYLAYGLLITVGLPMLMHNVSHTRILINTLFLLFFIVNVQLALGPTTGVLEVSWSVCVEEQFYLVWPVLLNKFRKNIWLLILVMMLGSLGARLVIYNVLPILIKDLDKVAPWGWINYVLIFDKLDLFAGGLLIAFLYQKRVSYSTFLQRIFRPWVQMIMLSACVLFVMEVFPLFQTQFDFTYIYLYHLITVGLFGYLLLSAVQPNSILRLENKLLSTLGKASYGIYMMHTAIAQFVLLFFKRFVGHPNLHFVYDFIYPVCALAATSAVACISYFYFESWFLKKKEQLKTAAQKRWAKKISHFSPPPAMIASIPLAHSIAAAKKQAETP